MRQGDIYRVGLDPTRGREQRGYRPVLIVSADAFNRVTKAPVVLPITTGGDFAKRIGYTVELCGTKTVGVVRCDQPRVIDLAERTAHFVERAPEDIVLRALAKLAAVFE